MTKKPIPINIPAIPLVYITNISPPHIAMNTIRTLILVNVLFSVSVEFFILVHRFEKAVGKPIVHPLEVDSESAVNSSLNNSIEIVSLE